MQYNPINYRIYLPWKMNVEQKDKMFKGLQSTVENAGRMNVKNTPKWTMNH